MIGMIETISAVRLTCDACGNVRIIDASEALPRRCAKKACQSTAWNKSSPAAAVEAKPQRKRAAKPQIEVKPQEEKPHIEDKPQRSPRAEKIARTVETPKSKRKVCPHGFLIVAGATACARCS